jgi:acyl-CoA dehydrogenase
MRNCRRCRTTTSTKPAVPASKALGEAGLLKAVVPPVARWPASVLDVRTLCIAREILAFRDGLADFAFAMQGLGTASISLFGSEELKRRYLPPVPRRQGRSQPSPLSEPEAGSDDRRRSPHGQSRRCTGPARRRKNLDIERRIADHSLSLRGAARRRAPAGCRPSWSTGATPGLTVAERIEVIAPHPLARLQFDGVRVPVANRLGKPGEGFKVAMATLDIFRSTVAPRAGLRPAARCTRRSSTQPTRKLFGAPLSDSADDASRDRRQRHRGRRRGAAGLSRRLDKDQGAQRVTREAAMAKMFATEAAQRVIDRAVQITAARASPRASRSRSFTGKSARSVSTRARPRCRRS